MANGLSAAIQGLFAWENWALGLALGVFVMAFGALVLTLYQGSKPYGTASRWATVWIALMVALVLASIAQRFGA